MMYKNYTNHTINDDYPYGEFPIEYTKYGKEALRNKLEAQERKVAQMAVDNKYSPTTYEQSRSSGPSMNMDLKMLLPLFKAMSSKGKVGTGDLMKTMLPLMGGDSKNLADIIGAFDNLNKRSTKSVSKIESYTRVNAPEE